MNKKYMVEMKLNNNTVFIPVDAIDEDDAKHEAVHIMYWIVYSGTDMKVIEAKETE